MSTYIVDISMVGKQLFSEAVVFSQSIGQDISVVPNVYKETISQILSIMTLDAEEFTSSLFMLPQWVSIIYVETLVDHLQAHARYKHACRAAAISLYERIVLSGLLPKFPKGSLYKLDTVNQMTIQFSVYINSSFV